VSRYQTGKTNLDFTEADNIKFAVLTVVSTANLILPALTVFIGSRSSRRQVNPPMQKVVALSWAESLLARSFGAGAARTRTANVVQLLVHYTQQAAALGS